MDSSFLEAIPEELREELRLDFERQKQAVVVASTDAAGPSSSTCQNLPGSPNKDQRTRMAGIFQLLLCFGSNT